MRRRIVLHNALMHHHDLWPKVILALRGKGLSQRDLAERAGVDQSTICRIAAGRGEPRFSAAMALIELAGGADALAREHGIAVSMLESPNHPPALTPQAQAATESVAQGVAHA